MHLDALSRRVREANGIVSDGSDTERWGEPQPILCTESINANQQEQWTWWCIEYMDRHIISQVWLLTIYKFPCFRNRLVYSSMEGLDEAWAVKFLFSTQHGVGTDVEGNEPQNGNFQCQSLGTPQKESGAAFRSTDAELTFEAARILSARSSFEVLRRSQINSWCWATESLSHQFIVRIVRIVVT
jgi:hypothetical protein